MTGTRKEYAAVVLLLTIAVAAMLAGNAVAFAQSAAPASRSQLDSDLARATGVSELLQVAARYASAGYQQEAKAIVDRAAQRARSSGDWQSISAAYLRLGYTDNANAAQRRSRSTSR